MGTALEKPDVHAVELEHSDQVQNPIMRQQREREVGTSKFEFHRFPRPMGAAPAIARKRSAFVASPRGNSWSTLPLESTNTRSARRRTSSVWLVVNKMV